MATDVIVLNGGSSSGKSSIARRLQDLLDQPWVRLGVDDLLSALAPSLVGDATPPPGRVPLLSLGADGQVAVGAGWRPVEAAWYRGVAAMAWAGLRVIIDEVLLDGGVGQQRLASQLVGLEVLWVGICCDPQVAAAREASRPDRIPGMAVSQAESVHQGVRYDLVVDTAAATVEESARAVLGYVRQG